MYFNFEGDGGVGFCRRARPAELDRRLGLHYLPTLHLWRCPASPHDAGLQPQVKQLLQRQDLTKRCKFWAPTLQKEVGWALEES